ncbi:MAG: hypothetical protein VX044_02745 [Planctomycetota bacterium]|nr:hypothetical protein [Planctomycetota bacterium]
MFRSLAVSVTLTAGLLLGQQAGEQRDREAGRPAARRAEQRARDMRSQLSQRSAKCGHVKVRVRLTNGNRLTGVLKDGRVVERVEGQRYVPAAASERGAGVRLDYVAGTSGFLFVPFSRLDSYRVLQRMTHAQLRELEQALQRAERPAPAANPAATDGPASIESPTVPQRAATASRRRLPPPPHGLDAWAAGTAVTAAPPAAAAAQAPSSGEGADASTAASEVVDPAPVAAEKPSAEAVAAAKQEAAWADLLRRFPPAAGWGEDKKQEISRRFVVIGAKPDPNEVEFVARFAEWLQACAHVGVDPAAGSPPAPKSRGEARRAARSRARALRK